MQKTDKTSAEVINVILIICTDFNLEIFGFIAVMHSVGIFCITVINVAIKSKAEKV